MTTPLLIGESVPKEVKNILKSLEVGQRARIGSVEGFIEFVSDEYITVCVSTKPNPKGSRQPMNKCCVCVYPYQWDDLEIEDEHFYDHKAFRGNTNDHPGNEMLPDIDDR